MATAEEAIARVEKTMRRIKKGSAARVFKNMTADQFMAHAQQEIEKASVEPVPQAFARLTVLQEGVEIAKATSWEAVEFASFPMFEDDTTNASDKTERAGSMTAAQPTATQFAANGSGEWGQSNSGQSQPGSGGSFGAVNHQPAGTQYSANTDWVKKFAGLQDRLRALKGEEEEVKPAPKQGTQKRAQHDRDGWPLDLAAPAVAGDDTDWGSD